MRLSCAIPLFILLVAPSASVLAEDWPWFLGLDHTGISGETKTVVDWSQNPPPVIWKKNIGTGYSAPSVLGDKLVLHHRLQDQEIISCRLVSTGEEVWQYSYPTSFQDPYGYNNGPRCSPVLTRDHCYTLGAEGMLVCVTLNDGEPVWQIDLQKKFTLPEWFFGMGCSPILDGSRLIVLVGGQPNSGVVAFNINDGSIAWQSVGKDTWDGAETDDGETYKWTGDEMVASYASPIIREIHGRRHLLCLMRQGLVSLDPENGQTNFKHWFRATVHESVNAARPVVIDDQIFLSAAYQVGSELLKVAPDGKSVESVWKNRRNMLAHWSTPIHANGYIYGFSGRHENEGELRCVRVSDGKVLWNTAGYDGDLGKLRRDPTSGKVLNIETGKAIPYPYFGRGSLIQVGNRFIVLGERGTLSVVDVNEKEFIEHGRFSLDEIGYPAWAAPVVSNGRMYLRSEDWLVCLQLAKTGE